MRVLRPGFTASMEQMPHPYFEMEGSRSVTSWVNRLYFESPRALSFLGLRLVKTRHKNLVPLLFGVKPHPRVGWGRCSESITVKCPLSSLSPCLLCTSRRSSWQYRAKRDSSTSIQWCQCPTCQFQWSWLHRLRDLRRSRVRVGTLAGRLTRILTQRLGAPIAQFLPRVPP